MLIERISAIRCKSSKDGCCLLQQYAFIVLKLFPSSFAKSVCEMSFSASTAFILFSFIYTIIEFSVHKGNKKSTKYSRLYDIYL